MLFAFILLSEAFPRYLTNLYKYPKDLPKHPEDFSRNNEAFLPYGDTFIQYPETFYPYAERFPKYAEDFSQYSEAFPRYAEAFSRNTEDFSQYPQAFPWHIEALPNYAEDFRQYPESFFWYPKEFLLYHQESWFKKPIKGYLLKPATGPNRLSFPQLKSAFEIVNKVKRKESLREILPNALLPKPKTKSVDTTTKSQRETKPLERGDGMRAEWGKKSKKKLTIPKSNGYQTLKTEAKSFLTLAQTETKKGNKKDIPKSRTKRQAPNGKLVKFLSKSD